MTGITDTAEMDWFQAPADAGFGLVRLVEGNTFCVAERSADIHTGRSEGLFFLDTRVVSKLELRVDHKPTEPLSVQFDQPFSAVHVGRGGRTAGDADSPLTVVRRRHIGRGMSDEVVLHNYDVSARACEVSLDVDADFADLFAVKGGQRDPGKAREIATDGDGIQVNSSTDTAVTSVSFQFDPPPHRVVGGSATWQVEVPPNSEWSVCVDVAVRVNDLPIDPDKRCDAGNSDTRAAMRLADWRSKAPRVDTDYAPFLTTWNQSNEDLGALRIFDTEHPHRAILAAGAPWFMTLFGRDSLLASWMALIADPGLALGTLQALADLQGLEVNPGTEEQPGRILHEVRFGASSSPSFRAGDVFYGSIDATPLFVMVGAELLRWGVDALALGDLLPHFDRAISWMEEFGDRDGDGYIEYERLSPNGPPNQGWKDSVDSIRHASGELAPTPIALCEVQGYAYAAYLGRARLADAAGDGALAARCRERAAALKLAFNRDFWSERSGRYVMALDRDKNQVDVLASNVGHCLWTGIVDRDRAGAVAKDLLSPAMSTGWGLRTLAASSATYNPVSYHSGSVWPHDTAIAVAGLHRYGFVEEANRLALDLFDLAMAEQSRLPELVAGFSREEFSDPVPYPTSCSPQAWAAGSPLLILRSLLGLEPDLPAGTIGVDPRLPSEIGHLHVDGIPMGDGHLSIAVEGDDVSIGDMPADLAIVRGSA